MSIRELAPVQCGYVPHWLREWVVVSLYGLGKSFPRELVQGPYYHKVTELDPSVPVVVFLNLGPQFTLQSSSERVGEC